MPGCVREGFIDAWVCTRGGGLLMPGCVRGGLLLPPWVCIGGGGVMPVCSLLYAWVHIGIFIRPNWIKIYGEEYHSEEFVMTGFQEDDLHHLEGLRIFKVLLILSGTTPLLAVQLYRTNGINLLLIKLLQPIIKL